MRSILLTLVVAVGAALAAPADAAQRRLAFVQPDGTLKVGQRIVRLFGIYIPPTNRLCRTFIRPVTCASRAALALDTKVERFVRCNEVARNRDGSVTAVCHMRDPEDTALGPEVDLSAWMLYQGWAVALPGAPIEYVTLERIAWKLGRGIWAFQADSITSR